MTRGIRKRPLREPEPDLIPVASDTSGSDVPSAFHDEHHRFRIGNPGGPGRKPHRPLTETLRECLDPVQWTTTLIDIAFGYRKFTGPDDERGYLVAPNLEAIQYIGDRLDGRPVAAVQVSTAEDDPAVIAAKQMADAWDRISLGLPPLTLIEAPVSQDTHATE